MYPTLAAYLHDIDPIAVWPIRWYGLSYLAGFVLGFLVIRHVVRVGNSSLRVESVGNLAVACALGVMIGARLGYVLFYQQSLLWTFDGRLPFWGLLAVNRGGMSSHGGMVGVVIAIWLYARANKHDWAHVLDLAALAAPLGLFFGRLANFVNGELYGRQCSESFRWAVKFPQEILAWDRQRLAWLDEVLTLLPPSNSLDEALQQTIIAVQNGNQQVASALAPLLTPRHPSQIYEAILEGLLLFVVLAVIWLKPRKPLMICGSFAVVYAIFRIAVEQFRQPDHDLGFEWLGLTRGQWLSIGLLLAGVLVLAVSRRRKGEPMGGLMPARTKQGEGE